MNAIARTKILFVAEAVTLAHVGRGIALASTLDPALFDVHFACASGYDFCFAGCAFTRWPITSIPSKQFLRALAEGKPVYDEATLLGYVDDDLRLIEAVQPDLIVGDFRLSLSVSARLKHIPYVSLTNAYWSPHVPVRFTVPDIPLTKFLPIVVADPLFRTVRPIAFAAHAVPLNKVRRKFGLPSLGSDLRRVYTDADFTLYMDVAEQFPAQPLPDTHAFIGPVIWSTPNALPEWWASLPQEQPVIYVTLGSSGQGRLLPLVLDALAPLPVTVITATAGNVQINKHYSNVFVSDFLPGELAASRSRLVICNGGSPTSQQALASGVPVVGIASNLDQFLNMHALVAAGAGILLRADRFDADALRSAVSSILGEATFAQKARILAEAFRAQDAGETFKKLIPRIISTDNKIPSTN